MSQLNKTDKAKRVITCNKTAAFKHNNPALLTLKSRLIMRESVLNHFLATESPRQLIEAYDNQGIFLMLTGAVTTYSKLNYSELIGMVRGNDQVRLEKFSRTYSDKIIIAYQEDQLPLFVFAYYQYEFGVKTSINCILY